MRLCRECCKLGYMLMDGQACTFLLVSWISPPMMNSSRMRYTCPGQDCALDVWTRTRLSEKTFT